MRLILSILLANMFLNSMCQDTIFSTAYNFDQPKSYFEDRDASNYFYFPTSNSANIWQIGTPSKIILNSAYSPSLALITDSINPYPINNSSTFELLIRTDDYTEISFWHRLNTDTLTDGGVIEISTNFGNSWQNVIDFPSFMKYNIYDKTAYVSSNNNKAGFSGNLNWRNTILFFNQNLNYARLKFTFTSDNIDTQKEGWILDNFEFTCRGTGINEANTNLTISIFPNPTTDYLNLKSDKTIELIYSSIKNIEGKTLMISKSPNIDLTQFNSGIYFIEILTNKGKQVSRFVKN